MKTISKITSVQKVIKVGDSAGVTLPARDMKAAGIKPGDEVEIAVTKYTPEASDAEVLRVARDILGRYKEDFTNLAKR